VRVVQVRHVRHAPARDQHAALVVHQELTQVRARSVQDALGLVEARLQLQQVAVLDIAVIGVPLKADDK
jgi:hypothetical protein